MIAVDTNLLVYAHREDSEFHEEALRTLVALAEGTRRWAIPWPCLHEFVAITTHPSIYVPPTPLETSFDALAAWLESPSCCLLGEGPGYLETLRRLAVDGRVAGPMIHDARVAAVCLHNGVTELWTADRDFSRFAGLRTANPLVRLGRDD